MTPVQEPQVYQNYVNNAIAFKLNLEESYNMIYAKVANTGDSTVITGLRIGTSATHSLHYEWKETGKW